MIKALVISLFLFLTVAVSAQPEAMVRVERANLREAPSTKAKVIATLRFEEPLEIIKRSGVWYRVRVKGHVGWLHQKVVAKVLYGEPVVQSKSDVSMQRLIEDGINKLGLTGINVFVTGGEATFTGTVAKDQLADVMRVAMEADVKRVNNKLTVK